MRDRRKRVVLHRQYTDLMEGTAGFWWKFYQGDFGSVRWGAQYE